MKSNLLKTLGAFLLLSLASACGGSNSSKDEWGPTEIPFPEGFPNPSATPATSPLPSTTPTVLYVSPLSGVPFVPMAGGITATFSQPMDPATLNPTTFTLSSGGQIIPVLGTVTYNNSTVAFWPTKKLPSNVNFKATITTGAKSAFGVALAAKREWYFTTANNSPMRVDLGTAANFAILAKTAVDSASTSDVTGDIGCSPAAASLITGFALTADASNVFSTSAQVTGQVFAANYAPPTPDNMTTSVSDMETAFTDAAGRAPTVTELGAGNIGGMTLTAGVYKWGTGLLIPTDVTLTGSATDVWIFQIAQDLTMASATDIILAGGALPENIFWQVAGLVDLGTTSHFEGNILCQTSITLRTGATIDGRLLAQTAVNIDGSTVVKPAN